MREDRSPRVGVPDPTSVVREPTRAACPLDVATCCHQDVVDLAPMAWIQQGGRRAATPSRIMSTKAWEDRERAVAGEGRAGAVMLLTKREVRSIMEK